MMFFEFIATLVILYCCMFALVKRICTCIERCKMYKAFYDFLDRYDPDEKSAIVESFKTTLSEYEKGTK